MKEAQPTADVGAHAVDPAQALRANAAASGKQDEPAPLAPEEADRFAMAFRPSWEPLAADQAAAPSTRPSIVAPRRTSLPPPAPVHDPVHDELLRLRGRRARSRSIGLAAVSVLSFSALVYWGISTTTSGTERASTRGLQPPPPAAEAAPAAEAPALEVARAPKLEPTGFARLADPNEPAQVAPLAEGEAQEPAPGSEGAATGSEPVAAEQQAAAQQQQEQAAQGAEAPATAAAAPAALPTPAAAPVAVAPTAASAAPSAAPAPAAVAPAPTSPAPPAAAAAKPAPTAPVAPTPSVTASSTPASAPKPTAAPTTPAAAPTPAAAQPTTTEPKPTAAIAAAPAPSAPAPQKTGDPARPPLLQVRAVPDSAQLWLDGQRMTNPFDTRLPLGSKHKLEAKQDGYETSSQTIRIESDARLTITLRQTPAAAPNIKVKPLTEGSRGAGFVTSNPY